MYRTIKELIINDFSHDEMVDIVNNSASAGFSGFIYYSETQAKYQQYKDEIWGMLYDDAEANGLSILELIASFNTAKTICTATQFENLLVWYALEKVAWDVTQDNPRETDEEDESN